MTHPSFLTGCAFMIITVSPAAWNPSGRANAWLCSGNATKIREVCSNGFRNRYDESFFAPRSHGVVTRIQHRLCMPDTKCFVLSNKHLLRKPSLESGGGRRQLGWVRSRLHNPPQCLMALSPPKRGFCCTSHRAEPCGRSREYLRLGFPVPGSYWNWNLRFAGVIKGAKTAWSPRQDRSTGVPSNNYTRGAIGPRLTPQAKV